MNEIRFEDAMRVVLSGNPVRLKYVSFDKKRKTGGQIKEMEAVATQPENQQREPSPKSNVTATRTANHFDHFTRNFNQCISGEPTTAIRRVHLELLLEVNGKKVML